MRDENDLLKGGLLLLGLVIAGWAFWRVWNYENKIPSYTDGSYGRSDISSQVLPQNQPPKTLETLKTQELLDSFLEEEPAQKDFTTKHLPSVHTVSLPTGNNTSASSLYKVSARPSGSSVQSTLPPAGFTQRAAVPSAPTTRMGNYQSAAPYYPTAHEEMTSERAHRLAPYLIPDKQAQQKWDRQLSTLSANITRALNRALMPKSKKETNIEKYMNRATPSAASAAAEDPFTQIVQQVGAQKSFLVQQTQDVFGEKAAQRTGALMNSFQQEVSQAAADTSLTNEQKAKAIQTIAQNYQNKLDQLNQDNQFNKFVEDRVAADNKKLDALKEAYKDNPNLQNRFAQIIEQSRQADLDLAQRTDLTPEEYAQQFYGNQYKLQEDLKQAAQKEGASVFPVVQTLNKLAAGDINNRLQAEEEGSASATPHRMTTTQLDGLLKEIDNEREKMLSTIRTNYGTETAARFEPILQEYRQKQIELGTTELSNGKREKAQAELVTEFNQKILQMQIQLVKESEAPEEVKNEQIKQLEQTIRDLQTPR